MTMKVFTNTQHRRLRNSVVKYLQRRYRPRASSGIEVSMSRFGGAYSHIKARNIIDVKRVRTNDTMYENKQKGFL
eukprot:gene19734-6894_t